MFQRIDEVGDLPLQLRVIIVDSGVEHPDEDPLASGIGGHLAEIPHHVLPWIVGYLRARLRLAARLGVSRAGRGSYQHAGGEGRQSGKY
ncbi:hypothetical protein Rhe02_95120 [Rhizocola hellebori]|uniref:Uncharacterized protein n=1 Tax=Rhizocola hellebori TaxID=1392758 RepID=A0A8J3QIF9_9ACTN|nr:hypothetical protein Rhe02_95120 [Rhizocola hellebori]